MSRSGRWLRHTAALLTGVALFAAAGDPGTGWAQDQGARTDAESNGLPTGVEAAMNTISSARIRVHLRYLSSDLLEGRGTGDRGAELAAEHIQNYFQLSSLWPGAPGNSYKQRVPLVGVETMAASTLAFTGAGAAAVPAMTLQNDYVLWTETQRPAVDVGGDVVFVGYGIDAPSQSWDDYKGLDVAGKVLLMLVNDPPSEDPNHFGGKGLTYFGRWTYKYEIAAKKGALGVLLIHTDESAGYAWDVVRNSWGKERSQNELDPNGPAPLSMAGWLTQGSARALLTAAGQDLDALRAAAARPDFRPVPLGLAATAHIETKLRNFESINVIGWVPGADEALKSEAVIITAHYDHLGVGKPDDTGDNVYNGAYDNASGVSAMLEMARAMRLGTVKPRRSIVFIAVTAEEQGLLGSEYYAENPTFAPGKIAANINMDGVSVLGVTQDMTFLGGERSTLGSLIADAASRFDFEVVPDAHPEQGFFYRSDHFNFAKIGVPSISIRHGQHFEGHEPEWGEVQWKEYRDSRYHRPSDEYDSDWDLDGAEQTARIAFYLAYRISESSQLPAWNAGDEFAAARARALDGMAGASN